MNISKTKLLTLFVSGFFLFGLTGVSEAANYSVLTTKSIVDGDIFCDGKCDSGDTIIIQGGARGALLFQDFDGVDSYITITNENTNPDSRVVITQDESAVWGVVDFYNCRYVDFRGNNDPDIHYGIKIINDCNPSTAHAVWIRGQSDYIKLSYLEISFDGAPAGCGTGIFIDAAGLDDTYTLSDFEFHHNWIHGSGYAAMYLGKNNPPIDKVHYVANIFVHDNLIEDCGAYGITVKGVHADSAPCSIYNNIVKVTGLVPIPGRVDSFAHGIGVQLFYGTTYANIYNNRIEYTKGPGLKIGDQKHNVYNNLILGCGTGNAEKWGHGIITYQSTYDSHIYDNIIIQPKRYGIYVLGTTRSVLLSRNLIGDAGIGEWDEMEADDAIESTGADANIYHADVADFNFNAWTDNNDYSDDDFTFGPLSICVGKCCSSLQTCQGGSFINSSNCGFDCCKGGTCEDAEICNDLVDNDGDGDIDCADADCVADPACVIPLPTCFAQSGNCCEGLFCGGTVVPSLDCGNCCLGICSFDGTVTCATQGFQCCTNGCQSGYKGYLEDTCPGEEVCCEICYVGGGIVSPPEEIKIKNPVKTSVFAQIIENTLMWSLSIVGSLALLMLIIGGAMYIGSAGDEQKVLNAKKIVTYTIIGTILILVSYAVIKVVGGILG